MKFGVLRGTLIALISIVCCPASAFVVGSFKGLDDLTTRADTVAIVRVVELMGYGVDGQLHRESDARRLEAERAKHLDKTSSKTLSMPFVIIGDGFLPFWTTPVQVLKGTMDTSGTVVKFGMLERFGGDTAPNTPENRIVRRLGARRKAHIETESGEWNLVFLQKSSDPHSSEQLSLMCRYATIPLSTSTVTRHYEGRTVLEKVRKVIEMESRTLPKEKTPAASYRP